MLKTMHLIGILIYLLYDASFAQEASSVKADVSSSTEASAKNAGNLPDETVCGQNNIQTSSRIINGTLSKAGEYPWMASVRFADFTTGNGLFLASATIINRRFLLTAGHLSGIAGWTIYDARIGETHFNVDPDCTHPNDVDSCAPEPLQIGIESVYVELDYFNNDTTLENDIGLFYLKECLNFTRWISPVCIPEANYTGPAVGEEVTAIGWGNKGPKPTDESEELLKVDLPVISKETCQEKRNKTVHDNEICVGTEGKGHCKGDSGGPLAKLINNHWYQVGIISRGVGCGEGSPGVSTRVASFRKWIDEVTNIKCKGDWNCGCPK